MSEQQADRKPIYLTVEAGDVVRDMKGNYYTILEVDPFEASPIIGKAIDSLPSTPTSWNMFGESSSGNTAHQLVSHFKRAESGLMAEALALVQAAENLRSTIEQGSAYKSFVELTKQSAKVRGLIMKGGAQ